MASVKKQGQVCCFILAVFSTIGFSADIQLAFPTAQGAGCMAKGGRGGDVYEVTKLTDTGVLGVEGEFRYGVKNATGPRTIVFTKGGIIPLTSQLYITCDDLTIAGQTAPGDGICFKDYPILVSVDNLIIRDIRIRTGDESSIAEGELSYDKGCLHINTGTNNSIIDHVSTSWGIDENQNIHGDCNNITMQWGIIAEGLNDSWHAVGPHSQALLLNSWAEDGKISLHHMLMANCDKRNPRFGAGATSGGETVTYDFRNNVIFNWGEKSGNILYSDENVHLNMVKNYFVRGNDTTEQMEDKGVWPGQNDMGSNNAVIWQYGNVMDTDLDLVRDGYNPEWDIVKGDRYIKGLIPHDAMPVKTDSAVIAYEKVLDYAGAFPRDSVDERIVDGVDDMTGAIIDSQDEVGGWPTYSAGTYPTDTDKDGMSDVWEDQVGLNKHNPLDRNDDPDRDGYTNMEEYLNCLTGEGDGPHIVDVYSPYFIAMWLFNEETGETAYDSTVFENDALLVGGVSHSSSGKHRYGLYFDGSGYLNCGNDESLNINKEITIQCWFKLSDLAEERAIFSRMSGHSLYPCAKVKTDGTAFFIYRVAGSTKVLSSDSGLIEPGMWHHFTGVINGNSGGGRFYIDGVQIDSDLSTGTIDSGTYWRKIGIDHHQGLWFKGYLDDFRLRNIALTDTEVLTDYDRYDLAPSQAASPTPANGATCVDVDAELSWSVGAGATSNSVYFGTTSGVSVASYGEDFTVAPNWIYQGPWTPDSMYWNDGIVDANFKRTDQDVSWLYTTEIETIMGRPVDSTFDWTVSFDIYEVSGYQTYPKWGLTDQSFIGDDSATQPDNYIAYGVYPRYNQGKFYATVPADSNSSSYSASDIYTDKEWYTVSMSYDSSDDSLTCMVNDSLVWETTISGNFSFDTFAMWDYQAGSSFANSIQYFDNLKITPERVLVSEGQSGTTYDIGTLDDGVTYHWRIDEVNPWGTVTTGEEWSFTTGTCPSPPLIDLNDLVATDSGNYSNRDSVYAVNGSGMSGAAHANDVANYKMWMSTNGTGSKWLKIDLGDKYDLDEMKVWNFNWSGYTDRGCKQVDVYYSYCTNDAGNPIDDPNNWILLGTAGTREFTQASGRSDYGTNENYAMPDSINFNGVTARWVALEINSHHGGNYFGLSELQFFGTVHDDANMIAVNNLTATAYNNYSNRDPAYAVDGSGLSGVAHANDVASYKMWMGANLDLPKWFKIDIGGSYSDLDFMKIYNFNWSGYTSRGSKNVQVYYSNYGSDPGNPVDNPSYWTSVRSSFDLTQAPGASDYGTTNSTKPDEVDLAGITARWLSIKINSHWGGSYCGLSEVQIYGDE